MEKGIIDLEKKEVNNAKAFKKSSGVDDQKLEDFLKEFEKCKKIYLNKT